VIGNLLFDVSPYNPIVATATICVLVVGGAIACLLPAARAAAIEPIVALRAE
jgi:ABC-type lipoprotein release transport system permease subunit